MCGVRISDILANPTHPDLIRASGFGYRRREAARALLVQHLDGDALAGLGVDGELDLAEGALTNGFTDSIVAY